MEAKLQETSEVQQQPVTVLLIAGEASSDEHSSELVKSLIARRSEVSFFGMGGAELRAAGMETVIDCETEASVMGFTEVLGSVRTLFAAYRTLLAEVDKRKPCLAILVDFPDFNLLIARALKRRGVKVFYFISPQLWAWRKGRIKTIKKYVSKVANIFPFEEAYFQSRGVDSQYVGHPFLDRSEFVFDREEYLKQAGLNPELPLLALLPGSRNSELERLLKPMLKAFSKLRRGRPGLQGIVPVAKTLDFEEVRRLAGDAEGVAFVKETAREALHAADAAVVASGTATIEAALAEVPFVVVYRLAPLTYILGRALVRGVKHFCMANLIAGETVVTELLQSEVTPERIAAEIERLLGDKKASAEMKEKLAQVHRCFEVKQQEPEVVFKTAGERAASIALSLIDESLGRVRA